MRQNSTVAKLLQRENIEAVEASLAYVWSLFNAKTNTPLVESSMLGEWQMKEKGM